MARKGRIEITSEWTVLLVDDDAEYRESTSRLLEREGHRVLQADCGTSALLILKDENVDLMLLDYFMPGMTGEEVVAELRTFNPYVQVILQTGYASEQPPRDLLRRLDIQGYHDKSEGPDKLLLWTDIGLKAAHTVQLLHKGRQCLRYLINATFDIHKIQTLDTLLQTILKQVTAMIGTTDSFLAIVTRSTAQPDNVPPQLYIKAGAGRFAGAGSVQDCLDPEAYGNVCDALAQSSMSVRNSATIMPLAAEGGAVGVIYIDREVSDENDIELLQIFASQSAIAIQNANLFAQAQQQVIQSEKLASIGQLAAGVAHEINNPIGYVFSNFGTLEKYHEGIFEMLHAYEEAQRQEVTDATLLRLNTMRNRLELDYLLEDIPVLMHESREGLSRVQKIVQDLKYFSHAESVTEWQLAKLHDGIDSTLNIVNNEVKYIADIVKEYGDIPEIECLPSQLNQVVMNLVVNAAHAMGSRRGTITIRTGTTSGPEGDKVWIEVQDTGSGIPQDILAKIFDPFFTTKPVGKGTGLGLSLSYGIIQKHHGALDVKSEVGVGTTFRITLPISQQVESPPQQ
ncbi:MAG: sensor histidine kinase [Rhodocyclales bacterium]|nr:sensor histidine kinase [Rhodocyclales bacterium]